jgi:hypothetical protein
MRKLIHVVISGFFKVFVPFIYVIFIFAGIISALVSAFIEYEVLGELYQKNLNTEKLYLSIPFLIVIAFESTKVFLIFLNKQYSKSGNNGYLSDKKYFLRLRYALISISVIATLIFSFYNLHNPEYETVFERTKQEITASYDTQIAEINNSFDNQLLLQTSPINEDIQSYGANMTTEENYKFRGRQEYRGPRYNEAKKLRDEASNRRIEVIRQINEQRDLRISEVNRSKTEEIDHIRENLQTSSASGNKMLSATLQIVNMEAEFPQWQYIAVIAFISLIISVGLELTIWSAFTVLAINHGDFFELDISSNDWNAKHKIMNETIDDMNETEAESYEKRAKKWSSSIINLAKKKAKKFRDNINTVVN